MDTLLTDNRNTLEIQSYNKTSNYNSFIIVLIIFKTDYLSLTYNIKNYNKYLNSTTVMY